MDGKFSSRDEQQVIGSKLTWWAIGDDCTYSASYELHFCPKTPSRRVVYFDLLVPGLIEYDEVFPDVTPEQIGKLTHLGDASKAVPLTKNFGITVNLLFF